MRHELLLAGRSAQPLNRPARGSLKPSLGNCSPDLDNPALVSSLNPPPDSPTIRLFFTGARASLSTAHSDSSLSVREYGDAYDVAGKKEPGSQ
jgi:hypothetical protein